MCAHTHKEVCIGATLSLDRVPSGLRWDGAWLNLHQKLEDGLRQLITDTCAAFQIIPVNFLRSTGVSFTSVSGHSSSEIAAVYASGILAATDAVRIAHLRGLVASLDAAKSGQPGAMLAAGLPAENTAVLRVYFGDRVTLAASNAPSNVTLSGDAQCLQQRLKDEKRFYRLLRFTAQHDCTILVPTHMKFATINPAFACGAAGTGTLLSDAAITKLDADVICGDVEKPATVLRARLGPFSPGYNGLYGAGGSSTEVLAVAWIALLCIKRVEAQLAEDDQRNLDWHRSRLTSWIDRTLSLTRTGGHPILLASWLDTSQEDFDTLLSKGSVSVMSEAANVVGTNLHLFFRGEASILEELRKNDILTRFYRHDMEMNMMNERLGDILGQFLFRYPRMTILEDIGRSHHSYTFTDICGVLRRGRVYISAHEDRFIFFTIEY
ncbi:hypothetical protein BDV23DRAFT_181647 [Aspergillus alliaceus]|uniref:Malonyl-CoA:ACP transacylase (MAT) domain-containing protein n=1 Tax=Petromyces alliaceus TaxID=209559 RepID=A0A5N7CDL7_PETAA|nr:hypothetical protein BDV23DRAFT_181647 [Aspergillus alliaceus]